MNHSLTESWYSVIDWLKLHCEDLIHEIWADAWEHDHDWSLIENQLGCCVPLDLKLFYQLQRGQQSRRFGGIFFGMRLLSFDKLVETWDEWRGLGMFNEAFAEDTFSTPPGYVKPQYSNPYWIPFASDEFGNHIAVDLDPDHLGDYGQIIVYGHEEYEKKRLANNINAFIHLFRDQLISHGVYYSHSRSFSYEDGTNVHYIDRFSHLFNDYETLSRSA
ncbi:MAG: SMI1/KNR4 family protein [Pseudomonadota bacterium]